jgi:DNA-binding response OmpR family regulator
LHPEQKRTILVVDDLEDNLELIRDVLAGEPYALSTATTAAEAMKLIEEQPVDLAILDVHMPQVDGYELFRMLREQFDSFCVPVLFLTAETANPRSAVRALDLGVWDYITKPFEADELRARIRAALRRQDEHRANIHDAQRVARRLST